MARPDAAETRSNVPGERSDVIYVSVKTVQRGGDVRLRQTREHQTRPVGHQAPADLEPDPGGCACDDLDPAVQR